MENREYKGLWWLPESPDETISGTLTFDPDKGGLLEIAEGLNFKPLNRAPIELTNQFPGSRFLSIVVGKSDTPITLVGVTWLAVIYDSHTRHFYRVDIVYKNEIFPHHNDIAFDRIDVVCDRLKMNDTRFSDLEKNSAVFPHTTFFLPDFEVICHISVPDPGGGKAERSLFRFRLKDPMPYAVFEQTILQLWLNFWTLIIGEPVVPLALYSTNPLFDGAQHPDRRIEIHRAFHQPAHHKYWFEKTHLWYFALDYKNIADDVQQALQIWYAMHARCRPIFDLYFDAVRSAESSSLHAQNLFLTYTRVIEGYHRVFHGGEYFNDETYKRLYTALMNTITEALPGDDYQEQRKYLEEMLRGGQAYSLGRRLEDLITMLLGSYKDVIHHYVARDVDAFIRSVQAARKELLDQTGITKSSSEMKHLAKALNIIIRLCLAHRLGFSAQVVTGIAMR